MWSQMAYLPPPTSEKQSSAGRPLTLGIQIRRPSAYNRWLFGPEKQKAKGPQRRQSLASSQIDDRSHGPHMWTFSPICYQQQYWAQRVRPWNQFLSSVSRVYRTWIHRECYIFEGNNRVSRTPKTMIYHYFKWFNIFKEKLKRRISSDKFRDEPRILFCSSSPTSTWSNGRYPCIRCSLSV